MAVIGLGGVVLWVGFVSAPQYARERVIETASGNDTSSNLPGSLYRDHAQERSSHLGIGLGRVRIHHAGSQESRIRTTSCSSS